MIDHLPRFLPSLKALHALMQIARGDSLMVASERLGVTRSALSHRIGDLERQLGVTLVRRQGRRLILTDDAETFLGTIGDAVARIEAAVMPLQRRRFELRLSTVATFASLWLLPRLGEFQTAHPDTNLMIATTQRAVDFGQEDVDCAIRHGLGAWRGLEGRLLFRETLVPVHAPGRWDGLNDAPVIRARSRFADWSTWLGAAGNGEPPDGGLIVETRAQALDAALGGAGAALVDARYLGDLIERGRLVRAGPTIQLKEGYWFVHRPRPRNERLIRLLSDWLVDRIARDGPPLSGGASADDSGTVSIT